MVPFCKTECDGGSNNSLHLTGPLEEEVKQASLSGAVGKAGLSLPFPHSSLRTNLALGCLEPAFEKACTIRRLCDPKAPLWITDIYKDTNMAAEERRPC